MSNKKEQNEFVPSGDEVTSEASNGLTRRDLVMDIGPKCVAALALASVVGACSDESNGTCKSSGGDTDSDSASDTNSPQDTDTSVEGVAFASALVGSVVDGTGTDYSPTTGTERQAIPSACWQCVTRDAMIGYVEDGRLTHLEGNPKLLRTNGKMCAKGQGGVGQVYDPDRLLFPMRRVAGTARGAGQWERISWSEALDELETRLAAIRADNPAKFMFHYGRMKASSSKLIKDYFLYGFGTKNYAGHTAICEAGKWTGQELVWGKHYDVNDVENSNVILNFGCNPMESHTNHIPLYQRVVKAVHENGAALYTFDVRLSNTASKSTEWIPIKVGTDLAVLLAMSYHILANDLAPQSGKDFINKWSNIDDTGFASKTEALLAHLSNPRKYITDARAADPAMPPYWDPADQPAGGYTPQWAETVTGVPASKIIEIAELYAKSSPGSTIITYRGLVGHFNGVMGERCALMLEAICGNIDVEGGRVHAVGASWVYDATYPKPSTSPVGLSLQNDDAYVTPTHHASHQVLEEIKKAVDAGADAPELYMIYCYAPAYANGDIQRNIDILTNEKYLPFIVTVDTSYTESAMYADLVLPDATYLERWDWEDMASNNMIPEYYIRQPLVPPLGEARDFKDVAIELARRLSAGAGDGLQNLVDVGSAKEFVRAACNDTPAVDEAGKAAGYADGFEFMVAEGAYYDPAAIPKYRAYAEELTLSLTDPATIADTDPATYVFKDAEGICWECTKAEFNVGYRNTSSAYTAYKGQEIDGVIYAGFKPDKLNKSGYFELDSPLLAARNYPSLPVWMKIPEHEGLAADELVLTSFKISTQTHSRSQNCKVLTEITHDNPAWINSQTAAALGIADGDEVVLTRVSDLFNDATLDPSAAMGTTVDSINVAVKVTDAIHPGAIAISHHLGHWAYGRYASGNTHPLATSDPDQSDQVAADPDSERIWWKKFGYRGNWIIPNAGAPIGGAHRIFDTVVRVQKA